MSVANVHTVGNLPMNAKNLMQHVPLDDFPGAGVSVWPELTAGVNGGIDAGVDLVADDDAELAATGIDEAAADDRTVVFAIMAEV